MSSQRYPKPDVSIQLSELPKSPWLISNFSRPPEPGSVPMENDGWDCTSPLPLKKRRGVCVGWEEAIWDVGCGIRLRTWGFLYDEAREVYPLLSFSSVGSSKQRVKAFMHIHRNA